MPGLTLFIDVGDEVPAPLRGGVVEFVLRFCGPARSPAAGFPRSCRASSLQEPLSRANWNRVVARAVGALSVFMNLTCVNRQPTKPPDP